MAEFSEDRFNTEIRYGLVGGPEFNTDVVVVDSGHESRNSNWLDSRSRYQLGSDNYTRGEIDWLIAFFRARRGRAVGFRLKDWSDFLVRSGEGRIGTGVATGLSSYQMKKIYVSGAVTSERDISKPVAGGVLLLDGSVWIDATYDTTTGVVTPPLTNDKTITSITKAANAVLNVGASHGFNDGEVVYVDSCTGMVEINDAYYTIVSHAASTVTLNVDSTAFTTYTGGGHLKRWQQSGAITWTGEFDVPVRFDTDKFETEFIGYRDEDHESLFVVSGLPLIEVRV